MDFSDLVIPVVSMIGVALLKMIVVPLMITLVSDWYGRSVVTGDARTACRISAGRAPVLSISLLCFGLALAAGYGCFYNIIIFRYGQAWAAGLFSGAMAFCGVTMLCYISRAYDVIWDEMGVTGPISYYFPPFGPGRETILFRDIEAAGMDWGGSYCIWDGAGTRILWSYLYPGFAALNQRIVDARPDLFPEEDKSDDP